VEILRDGGEIYYSVISPVFSLYADRIAPDNLGATTGKWLEKAEKPADLRDRGLWKT
jgi:hypothetical protein